MSPKHLPISRISTHLESSSIVSPADLRTPAIHVVTILLDPTDQSPENVAEISAEVAVVRSCGGRVFLAPDRVLYAVAFPFPVQPKHAGLHRRLASIPPSWR